MRVHTTPGKTKQTNTGTQDLRVRILVNPEITPLQQAKFDLKTLYSRSYTYLKKYLR